MERIQIAYGRYSDLALDGIKLMPGEPFLNIENGTAELIIGNPLGDSIESSSGEPEKIVGQGSLSFIGFKNKAQILKHWNKEVITNYNTVYQITEDINLTTADIIKYGIESICELNDPYNVPELPAGTIIAYVKSTEEQVGIGHWIRWGASSGGGIIDSTSTKFEKDVKTVQQALAEVDRAKLEWGGTFNNLTGTVTKTDIIAAFKGKNYAKVGKIYQNLGVFTYNGQLWDKYDFLILQSQKNKQYNATEDAYDLTEADIDVYFMQAGNHFASELHYTAGNRDATADDVYDDTGIDNPDDALDTLFLTKADLDPKTHKILLSQLPDTILGSMDPQGTWNKKSLPTAADKTSNDVDDSKYNDRIQKLVKGDYWAYIGDDWVVDSLVTDGTIMYHGILENDEHYIVKSGDWLIYNGNDKWGIADHTDAFTGVKADSYNNAEIYPVIDGIVTFTDGKRSTGTIEILATQKDQEIQYTAPNSALIPDTDDAAINVIYKSKTNKELTPSGLTDDTEKLRIENSKGQVVITDNTNTATVTINDEPLSDSLDFELPNHSGTLSLREDSFEKGTDDYLPIYKTDANNNPYFDTSNISEKDSVLDINDTQIDLHNDDVKTQIKLGTQLTETTELTLPTHSGTVSINEDTFAKGDNTYLPIYRTDTNGTQYLESSNLFEKDGVLDVTDNQIDLHNKDVRSQIKLGEQLTATVELTLPNHSGTISIKEDSFEKGEDTYIPVYRTDDNGNPYFEAGTISDDDTDIVIEDRSLKLTDTKATTHITQNTNVLEDAIELKLPNKSGTLALNAAIFEEGTSFNIPMYDEDKDEDQILRDSPLKVQSYTQADGTTTSNPEALVFSRTEGDTTIVFRSETQTQFMPKNKGIVLNNASIIDGGLWLKGKRVQEDGIEKFSDFSPTLKNTIN